MTDVPLPFTLFLFVLCILGLVGNIRFIYCNYRHTNLHKQLLILLTALQSVCCILEICDIIRVFFDISLTRASCQRFTGALFTTTSFAIANLYSLLGVEVMILIYNPNWYEKLKVWWFHAAVSSTLSLSGWWNYKSWLSEEDSDVLMCIPRAAMIQEVNNIRSKWILISNCFILLQYVIIIGMLSAKKNRQRSSYANKVILSSVILIVVFTFSWFISSILVVFGAPICRMLNIPSLYVLLIEIATAMSTFCLTHYVYFFVKAENRREFWRKGPIILFISFKPATQVQSYCAPIRELRRIM